MNKTNSRKNHLIMTVKTILQQQAIGTQEELCEALAQQGFTTTQVAVSRIMHQLGVSKINEHNKMVYRLPIESASVNPIHSLQQLILKIDCNESLVLVQTTPGSAQLVARLLDTDKNSAILGTVAGDDTIFIAPKSIKQTQKLKQEITTLLLGGFSAQVL